MAGNPINHTLRRAAQQLQREMKRNKGDVSRAEKRYEKRRIREMVKAARKGKVLSGVVESSEHTKLQAAKKQAAELVQKLAAIEKLLPSAKPRKKKK
jgi:L-lactate utilization protein LutC